MTDVRADICKLDDEQQLVFGWASITKTADGKLLVDRQGDVIASTEELEKAAYDYVLHSRDGGEQHVRRGVATLVESMVVTPEKLEKMGLPSGSLPTGWWIGMKVHEDDVWDQVKKGDYASFSVHGLGKRTKARVKGGAWTDIGKGQPDSSDVHVQSTIKRRKKRKMMERIKRHAHDH